MKKRGFLSRGYAIILSVALLLGLPSQAQAAGLTAAKASGPVTINGQLIDNSAAQYPLLLYRNITYFPMTYHLCRFLGVETDWDGSSRTLSIDRSGVNAPYVADTGGASHGAAVSVSRVNYNVVVNGIPVDNDQAAWPLLNYNNITYFPLTWQFAVESFGWNYAWDEENGLRINSRTNYAPPQDTDTGDHNLNAVIAVLNACYAAGGTYSGTLENLDTGVSQTFSASMTTEYSTVNRVVRFTAEPFIFFSNGASVAATYVGGDLSSTPILSAGSTGGLLEAEAAMLGFSGTELGYLSCCCLDFQFSGLRTEKIAASEIVSSAGGKEIWKLRVDFDYGNYTSYMAELAVDIQKGTVDSIQLETENYTLLLVPV